METQEGTTSPDRARRQFLRLLALSLGSCLGGCTSAPASPTNTSAPASPTSTSAPALPTPISTGTLFDGAVALEHAAAQLQWIPRHPGTPGWQHCGDYIAARLAAHAWVVEEQRFEYRATPCRNIIGKRGHGPPIIVGAHYDTRRYADRDPDPARRTEPVPGANDGASGIAALLELARVLDPQSLGFAVWLAAFDAEDNGDIDGWEWVVGSTHLATSLTAAPLAVVVLDMIGEADLRIPYERASDRPIRAAIWQVARELGYAAFVPEEGPTIIDDHTPFLQRGYRAVDVIDINYPAWHTTADTLDKISAASLEAVGRTVQEWLRRGAPAAREPVEASPA